jgi:uncharacterized protein
MSIESPCIKVCVIDPATGFCIGCGRTGHEIGSWMAMTPETRRSVIADLPSRLKRMTARDVRPRLERRVRS